MKTLHEAEESKDQYNTFIKMFSSRKPFIRNLTKSKRKLDKLQSRKKIYLKRKKTEK